MVAVGAGRSMPGMAANRGGTHMKTASRSFTWLAMALVVALVVPPSAGAVGPPIEDYVLSTDDHRAIWRAYNVAVERCAARC